MTSYWDTSALIPCFLSEDDSRVVRGWLEEDGDSPRFTSWITLFEFETVLKRKLQQKQLSVREYHAVQDRWADFQGTLNLLPLDERVSRMGLKIQKIYGVWTCDAVQIGTASLLQLEDSRVRFVSLDRKLVQVARQEGFACLTV